MRMIGLGCVLALLGVGCGDDDGVPELDAGGVDAGPAFDAGGEVDAGGGVDAGEVDAGGSMDAGTDAGDPVDAGPLLPDYDAGNPFGDAGTLGAPEWVTIDVLTDGTTCTPLTACGGDVVGTWDVAGGCIEIPVPEELSRCPGATVTGEGRARGRVTFTETLAIRTAQSEVTLEVFVPSFCASFPGVGGCEGIESGIAMTGVETACAEDTVGNCVCAIRQVDVIDDGDAYTIEGNQIVSASLMKRWDYCIEGTELRYRDVSSSGALEPGIIELARR